MPYLIKIEFKASELKTNYWNFRIMNLDDGHPTLIKKIPRIPPT
jgi:hypothetical protein